MSVLHDWALTSPADDFWVPVCILVAIALGAFTAAFYFLMRKRVIEDLPTSRIGSAAQGYVELEGKGKLMEGPPIIAPLTGKTCLWYSFEVAGQKKGENSSSSNSNWSSLDAGSSDELFLIVDESGHCIIDPEGASVTVKDKDVWYGSTRRPTHGPGRSRNLFNSGAYRYTEKRLHPGDPLYTLGLFNTVGGAGDVYDASADVRELLKEWKRNSAELLQRFDSNKDGAIDMQEWQAVREAALKQVMDAHNERKTGAPVNLLARTRDKRRPFLLSALPQHDLTRRYHYYAMGLLLLFFCSGAFASWAINLRLAGT